METIIGTSEIVRGLVVSVPLSEMKCCPRCGNLIGNVAVSRNGNLEAFLIKVDRCSVCDYNMGNELPKVEAQ